MAQSSSRKARDALQRLAAGEGDLPPPLAAVAAAVSRIAPLFESPPGVDPLPLAHFVLPASAGYQNALTLAVERQARAQALAEAAPDEVTLAHLHSCDGRFWRVARLPHQQLSDDEVTCRAQRYLRLPLRCLQGLVGFETGAHDCKGNAIIIDAYGDGLLSGYHAESDVAWSVLHDELRDAILRCAKRAGIHTQFEQSACDRNRKRAGDLVLLGKTNIKSADGKDVWGDVVVVSATLPSYSAAAAAQRGGAAGIGAAAKHRKHNPDIPSGVFFTAYPFEADGYVAPILIETLKAFSKTRADRDNADISANGAWFDFFLDDIAFTHARFLSRCIVSRALAWRGTGSQLRHVTLVDAEAGRERVAPVLPRAAARVRRPAAVGGA
jgi:hypothetical protein